MIEVTCIFIKILLLTKVFKLTYLKKNINDHIIINYFLTKSEQVKSFNGFFFRFQIIFLKS